MKLQHGDRGRSLVTRHIISHCERAGRGRQDVGRSRSAVDTGVEGRFVD